MEEKPRMNHQVQMHLPSKTTAHFSKKESTSETYHIFLVNLGITYLQYEIQVVTYVDVCGYMLLYWIFFLLSRAAI